MGEKVERISASPDEPQNLLINELQLILAEKRTTLSVLRTGIAVIVLPLSILSVLVATSRFYETPDVLHLLAPLLVICSVLILLGFYLIFRSIVRIHRYDRMIGKIKQKHSVIAEFID